MRLGLKIAACITLSALAGGLAAARKGSFSRPVISKIAGDVQTTRRAIIANKPVVWRDYKLNRPEIKGVGDVGVENDKYAQIVATQLNIWKGLFAIQLQLQIANMQALDPQAEARLDVFRKNLQETFDIQKFLDVLVRDISPEYLSMLTSWNPPQIVIKTRTGDELYYGIYHPDDHLIVLAVPESFSPQKVCEIFTHEIVHSGQLLEAPELSAVNEGVADLLALRATNSLDVNYKPQVLLALIYDIIEHQYITNSFVPLVGFESFSEEKDADPLSVIQTFGHKKFKQEFLKHVQGTKKSACDVYLGFYLYFTKIISYDELILSIARWKDLEYVKKMIEAISLAANDAESLGAFSTLEASHFEHSEPTSYSEEELFQLTEKPYILIPKVSVIRSSIYAFAILALGFMVGRRRKKH